MDSDYSLMMERGFDVRSGSIAIGDPAMGLATFELRLPPGRYRCDPGALRPATSKNIQTICLDGPFLFVVDATLSERFLDWFHRTFRECGFVIPSVAMRLDEASAELGSDVGFYWEESLSGQAREGTYLLDATKIIRAT